MKKETIFRLLAEGGGIDIVRISEIDHEYYEVYHCEFDPGDEGLDVNERKHFPSFETAFQNINERYPWHRLHISNVHPDFKSFIMAQLAEKQNKQQITPEEMIKIVKRINKG